MSTAARAGLTCAILPLTIKGSSCDPAYQADYLNSMNTDLNVNVGLCLGHGLIFQKHSKAPVTTLIVKDFATKHNPLANLE